MAVPTSEMNSNVGMIDRRSEGDRLIGLHGRTGSHRVRSWVRMPRITFSAGKDRTRARERTPPPDRIAASADSSPDRAGRGSRIHMPLRSPSSDLSLGYKAEMLRKSHAARPRLRTAVHLKVPNVIACKAGTTSPGRRAETGSPQLERKSLPPSSRAPWRAPARTPLKPELGDPCQRLCVPIPPAKPSWRWRSVSWARIVAA